MRKIYAIIMAVTLAQSSYAQDPNLEWAKQIGGTNSDVGYAIVTDSSGNVYTLGTFEGTVDFDPGSAVQSLTATGGDLDLFVQKLDVDGNFLWVAQIKVSGGIGNAITLDNNGNICIAGNKEGNIFVQKFDANGNVLWATEMGGVSGGGSARSIAADDNGNIYTTGFFDGTVDFDPGPGVQNLTLIGSYYTYSNMFIQKLDANGNFLWVKQRANNYPVFVEGYAISTDNSGDVYVLGSIYEINVGTAFVEKLDANGNSLWSKSITGMPYLYVRAMTTDAIGNVYTIGSFSGIADFDPGPGTQDFTSVGDYDIFIQKLDTGGNFVWAKRIEKIQFGYSIFTDVSGNVYTTGSFEDTVDFDPGPGVQNLTAAAGTTDMFIQKLDAAGNFLWGKQIIGSGYAVGHSITIDVNDNIYTTGVFDDTIDFDSGLGAQIATSAGGNDLFIHKLSPCIPAGIDSQIACTTYTWIDGNTYVESNNTATFSIADGAFNGCDSLVVLDLTINSISDISTSVNGATITANNSDAMYQWLDCDNNYEPIPGETNQNFTANMNGNYAVELTENGCAEISDCVSITTVGLAENSLKEKFLVYPNPTDGAFAIEFNQIQQNLTVRLFDALGQLIEHKDFRNTDFIELDIRHPNGIYMLELLDADGNKAVLKLLKE